jgi:hypothetical protein
VFSWLSRFAIVVALACSIGLHWALCQAFAWANMVATYSRDTSLTEAIVKTFDGKHPCPLCKQISKSKRAEKKTDSTLDLKKQEFPYVATLFLFEPPSFYWEMRDPANAGPALPHAPPVPPPRLLPA